MLTFGELATFFSVSAARTRPAMLAETEHLMHHAAGLARSYIGVEQPDWAPLAESTIADKVAKGFPVPYPLLRTGEMRESIEPHAEMTTAGVDGVVGSTSEIALYQEVGTSRIPPRPFMGRALLHIQPVAEEGFGHLAIELLVPGEG